MKIGLRLFGALLAAVLLLTGINVEAAARGETDWGRQVVTVTGYGVAPTGTRAAQARILARRAAIVDAYRYLAEYVQGVNVDAETTVADAMTQSDVVKTKVNAIVKGAKIVPGSEKFTSDGGYEVTLELPMFGATDSLAYAVMERPEYIEPFPEPAPEPVIPSQPRPHRPTINGQYTGVIIDCTGFKVQPVMSPVIKNANGQKIYGHKNIDPDYVIAHGMVDYVTSISKARRAGSNPLILKAIDMQDFDSTPVVTVSDGNLMLSENDASGFLADTAVVFLY